MKNDCLDAITSELEAAGVPYDVSAQARHVHVRYGEKGEHLHVVAKTPSDWRAHKNERAAIRRDLRNHGYISDDQEPEVQSVPVIVVRDEAPKCTSVDIAHNFGKAHKDVLRAIDAARENCGAEFDQRNFAPIEYLDGKGRKYRAFELTRDGFSLVCMGFTGAEAMRWKVAYIDAFGQMERALASVGNPDAVSAMRAELDAALELMAGLETPKIEAPSPRKCGYIPQRMLDRKAKRRNALRGIAA